MIIGFDMDGVITEGRYIDTTDIKGSPREAYLNLDCYDDNTAVVWNKLSHCHKLYIISARSYYGAAGDIQHWLHLNRMNEPVSIICSPYDKRQHTPAYFKRPLLRALALDAYFDDNPELTCIRRQWYLMDNPNWIANQAAETTGRIISWKQIDQIISENMKDGAAA